MRGICTPHVLYKTNCSFDCSDWILKKESPTTCSITGSAISFQDMGEWNCHLQSKPIASGEHSTYDSDQVRNCSNSTAAAVL